MVAADVIVSAPGQESAVALQTTFPSLTILIFKSSESSMHPLSVPKSFKPSIAERSVSAWSCVKTTDEGSLEEDASDSFP